MTDPQDFSQFLRRHNAHAYAQQSACQSYAYGVDIRRTKWLIQSNIGSPLARWIDRQWPKLTKQLESEALAPADTTVPSVFLQEIQIAVQKLRAPIPVIRVLREDLRDSWPFVTPLATSQGTVRWLVLDTLALQHIDSTDRIFLFGAALGHLHCEHGFLFAMQKLAESGHPFVQKAQRTLLNPWQQIVQLSADRAGLLSVGDLSLAMSGLELSVRRDAQVPWLNLGPSAPHRRHALGEFDRSTIVARMRAKATVSDVAIEEDSNTESSDTENSDTENSDTESTENSETSASEKESDIRSPEFADTWSLARCDQRMTERLGLF